MHIHVILYYYITSMYSMILDININITNNKTLTNVCINHGGLKYNASQTFSQKSRYFLNLDLKKYMCENYQYLVTVINLNEHMYKHNYIIAFCDYDNESCTVQTFNIVCKEKCYIMLGSMTYDNLDDSTMLIKIIIERKKNNFSTEICTLRPINPDDFDYISPFGDIFSVCSDDMYIHIPIVHIFTGNNLNCENKFITLKNKDVKATVQIYKISDNLIITLLKKFFVKNICIFDCNTSKNKLYKNEISKFILNNHKEINLIKNKLTNICIKPSKYIYDNLKKAYDPEAGCNEIYIDGDGIKKKIVISYIIDCSKVCVDD